MKHDMILALDFGGTESRALARRIRNEHVYCEILPADAPIEMICEKQPKGIILIGAPADDKERQLAQGIFSMRLPILAMGYGAKALLEKLGGRFTHTVDTKKVSLVRCEESPLFGSLTECYRLIENAGKYTLPEGFINIAFKDDGTPVAFGNERQKIYGLQFGAEQNDPDGLVILHNFCTTICGCSESWSMEQYMSDAVREIREKVGNGKALITISGGVDSAVTAALMHKAIGNQLQCLYVDTGLMRRGERNFVSMVFENRMGMKLHIVNASESFFAALQGISSTEQKQSLIEKVFEEVYAKETAAIGKVDYLVQGTIYPDILNNGGTFRPEQAEYTELLEPLRMLFKGEVRELGELLGLPPEMVRRQAFPGPGFAVRCMGEVTADKIDLLRAADAIFTEEIVANGLEKRIGQYFAVLLSERTSYEGFGMGYTVALRAMNFVGADEWAPYRLPYDLLERVVDRIIKEVKGVNRVVYDMTPKPPAAIEWI